MMSARHVALALTVLLAFLPAGSDAHHFKGLPHFSYFENYPQVPQEEYLWQKGEYEFSLVIYDFQGIEKTEAEQPDDARLYLVVWSLRENKVYSGSLTLRILDHGEPVHSRDFPAATEENIYSLQHTLPETGRYSLGVELHDGSDLHATIPFKLSSQKVRWGRWVAGVLLALVAVVAVGSRRARIVKDRRELARAKRKGAESHASPGTPT
jgi:hypothetical protein